jgi:hypothetical protein
LELQKMVAKKGLYANIAAKKARIAAGSGETMRKVGAKGAPTASSFKKAAKTAKPVAKEGWGNSQEGFPPHARWHDYERFGPQGP